MTNNNDNSNNDNKKSIKKKNKKSSKKKDKKDKKGKNKKRKAEEMVKTESLRPTLMVKSPEKAVSIDFFPTTTVALMPSFVFASITVPVTVVCPPKLPMKASRQKTTSIFFMPTL